MTLLEVDQLSHHFFSDKTYTKALENISFTIDEGEFVSIIGPSGCGKSTILSIIARLMEQTNGSVHINQKNHPVTTGYMLQQDYLFPWKTILENICIGPKIQGTFTKDTTEQAQTLLEEVGLPEVSDQYPSELSGGMRQRVALVRTLLPDPAILLFDEPFSALDFVTKLRLENLVAKMVKQYEKTVLFVTHDLAEAISMSDRIFLMKANPGEIVKTYTVPEDLRNTSPFLVRRHEAYQAIFDEIWNDFHAINKGEEFQ